MHKPCSTSLFIALSKASSRGDVSGQDLRAWLVNDIFCGRMSDVLSDGCLQVIRLAQSQEIDLVMFVDNILARLHTQETSVFNAFISAIPPTHIGHAFKVLLCKHYLASLATQKTKPRPQVRAQPRRRGTANVEAPLPSESKTIPPVSALVEAAAKVQSPDILRLLSQTSPSATRSQCARIKFELVAAYDMLQRRTVESAKDMEWASVIQNGSLHQIFDSNLADDDDGADHRDLQEMAALRVLLAAMLSPQEHVA